MDKEAAGWTDLELGQVGFWTNARQEEQFGGANGSCRQDHFLVGASDLHLFLVHQLHTDRLPALEDDLQREGVSSQRLLTKVGAWSH